jgi:hypothetical protein
MLPWDAEGLMHVRRPFRERRPVVNDDAPTLTLTQAMVAESLSARPQQVLPAAL